MLKKLFLLLLGFLLILFTPLVSFAQEEPASSGVSIPDIYPVPPSRIKGKHPFRKLNSESLEFPLKNFSSTRLLRRHRVLDI